MFHATGLNVIEKRDIHKVALDVSKNGVTEDSNDIVVAALVSVGAAPAQSILCNIFHLIKTSVTNYDLYVLTNEQYILRKCSSDLIRVRIYPN